MNNKSDDKDTKLDFIIDNTGIEVTTDREVIETYIQNPAIWLTQLATGVLSTMVFPDKKSLLQAGGRLLEASIKWRLNNQLWEEIKTLQDEVKINDTLWKIKNNQTNLLELLQYIDNTPAPDETLFTAMKSIFLTSIMKGSEEHADIIAHEYLMIIKKFSSIDILVLKTAYKMFLENQNSNTTIDYTGLSIWDDEISKRIGLVAELVSPTRIKFSVNSSSDPLPTLFNITTGGVGENRMHGLSELGLSIGRYITNFDKNL